MKYQAIKNIGLAAVIAGSSILTSGCRTSDIYSKHGEMYNTVISDIEHQPRNERELRQKRRLAKNIVAAIYESEDTNDIHYKFLCVLSNMTISLFVWHHCDNDILVV